MDYFNPSDSKDFRSVPPPENLNKRQSYSKSDEISSNNKSYEHNYVNRRQRVRTEDDYFEDDNEEQTLPQTEYIPKPGSPAEQTQTRNEENEDSDSEGRPFGCVYGRPRKEYQTKTQTNH